MISHPNDAVRISSGYVPGLNTPAKQASALAVLQATIPILQGGTKPGYNDPSAWQSMTSFLTAVHLVKQSGAAQQAYTNDYLPA